MRVSIFLVPAATAVEVFAATAMPPDVFERRLASRGVDADGYRQDAARVVAVAEQPQAPKELASCARESGVAVGTLLRMLAYEGRLLRVAAGSLRADTLRYVATDAWLGSPLAGLEDAHASEAPLAWLAARYLHAFGPARAADFAWWAGVTLGRARRAVAATATVDVGDGLLLPAADEAAFARARPPAGSVVVLPKWDAYTMGYAPDGRARCVHPDVQSRVYTTGGDGRPAGDGLPVVLFDGEVLATWALRKGGEPTLEAFDTLGPKVRAAVEERLAAAAALLDG